LRAGPIPFKVRAYLASAGERVVRKADGPGEVCGFAETTAVEETADSAEHQRQHQTDSEDVEVTADRELVVEEIKKDDDNGEGNTAQKFEAALPYSKDGKRTVAEGVEIMDDVEEACAGHATNKGVECGVGDKLGVGGEAAAEAPYEGDGGEKADDHHQAVAFYGQVDERYFEEFRMHQ